MADITMPRLSDAMEEGTIARWLKRVGDSVARGEVIAQIDTDKATMDLEAYESGVLEAITLGDGESAPIGQVIGRVGTGKVPMAPADTGASADASRPSAPSTMLEPEPRVVPPSPAPETDQPAPAARSSGDGGGQLKASPVARAMAREHGIDLEGLRGSGPSGRVVKVDVERLAQDRAAVPEAAPTSPGVPVASDDEEVPLSNIRRVAARRIVESMQSTPHFYLTRSVDAEALTAFRADLNNRLAAAGEGVKVSVTDLLVKACATALRAVPDLNVSWADDRLLRHQHINIGIAVATDSGLVVPVVRDADQKSLRRISLEAKALIATARADGLVPSQFSDGTFTISNLGMYGVEQFTAVINPPEAALLTVGATTPRVVAHEGVATIRQTFSITLAIDHRALDGAAGAVFLQWLVPLLEDPLRIVV